MISDEQLDEWERISETGAAVLRGDPQNWSTTVEIERECRILALIAEVRRLRGKAEILFPTGRHIKTPLEAEDE